MKDEDSLGLRVLLIGGLGYLGIELAFRMAQHEKIEQLTLYDNFQRASEGVLFGLRRMEGKSIRLVKADILDSESLQAEVDSHNVVVNLAAAVPTIRAEHSAHGFEQVNNWGAAAVARSLSVKSRKSADLTRIVHVGSMAALPYLEGESFLFESAEEYYALSKARGERHFKSFPENISSVIVRLPKIFGYSKNMRIDNSLNKSIFDAHYFDRIILDAEAPFQGPHLDIESAVDYLSELAFNWSYSGIYEVESMCFKTSEVLEVLKYFFPRANVFRIDQGLYFGAQGGREMEMPAETNAAGLRVAINNFIEKFIF